MISDPIHVTSLVEADLLTGLLARRGLTGELAQRFLNPSYDHHLHDPYLLTDMAAAAERIADAGRVRELLLERLPGAEHELVHQLARVGDGERHRPRLQVRRRGIDPKVAQRHGHGVGMARAARAARRR